MIKKRYIMVILCVLAISLLLMVSTTHTARAEDADISSGEIVEEAESTYDTFWDEYGAFILGMVGNTTAGIVITAVLAVVWAVIKKKLKKLIVSIVVPIVDKLTSSADKLAAAGKAKTNDELSDEFQMSLREVKNELVGARAALVQMIHGTSELVRNGTADTINKTLAAGEIDNAKKEE